MSLISSVFSDPLQFSGTDLLQPFMDLGIDTGQPNRYRHHYHRHREHRYRRGLGRGQTGENLGTTTGTEILPLLSTLKEDDEKFTLLVDIPGLSKEQCSLRLDNDLLVITATPKRERMDLITESEQQIPYGTGETKEGTPRAGEEQQQQQQASEGRLQSGGGPTKEKIVWSERPTEPTVRTIPIPVGVDLSKISAKEEHGVLCVTMLKDPNFQANQARRIEVG